MDEIGRIDLEGRKFVCSPEEFAKVSTEDGCQFNLVSEKTYSINEDSFSDDDDEAYVDSAKYLEPSARLEKVKRDYISISLNSNRDPRLTKNKPMLAELLGEENDETSYDTIEYGLNHYHQIHKRYQGISGFEAMLTNQESKFEEVSPGRVYKRRTIPGVGDLISEESLVIYNCAFWTENATEPYDSSWLRRNTIVTDMAQDSLLPGLRELLVTTKKGEWCEAIIKPEAAFGRLGVSPRIPPNATIFCLLEIVKVIMRDKIAILSSSLCDDSKPGATFEDLFEATNEARKRGNHYYEQKQYRAAQQRYRSAIDILENLTYKNEEEENKAKELLLKLYNNVARAANASGDPRQALYACKQASLLKEYDSKTFWHKIIAWKTRGQLDRSLSVARRGLQVFSDPGVQRTFRKEIVELEGRIQRDRGELDNLYRLMGRAIIS